MELNNVYRGNVIKCMGFVTGCEPIVGESSIRYGMFDCIYKFDTVLVKISDDKYLGLFSLNSLSDYSDIYDFIAFDDFKFLIISDSPKCDGCLYVDKASLKPYRYVETSEKSKKIDKCK